MPNACINDPQKEMAISVKSMCWLAFLSVLLSLSEVAKALIVDSFPEALFEAQLAQITGTS